MMGKYYIHPKGQKKPKAHLARCRFSQKMNEQICFVCREKQKSKQNKFVCSFFGRIYGAPICIRFYLTINKVNTYLSLTLHCKYFYLYSWRCRCHPKNLIWPSERCGESYRRKSYYYHSSHYNQKEGHLEQPFGIIMF